MKDLQQLNSVKERLFEQSKLHWRLMKVEWAEEKNRILQIIVAACIGFACLMCLLIFLGILVIALCWNTNYFITSIASICVFYGLVLYLAWRRISALLNHPNSFFAATRAEMAGDLDMIKQNIL